MKVEAKNSPDKWDRTQIVKLVDLFEEEPSLCDTPIYRFQKCSLYRGFCLTVPFSEALGRHYTVSISWASYSTIFKYMLELKLKLRWKIVWDTIPTKKPKRQTDFCHFKFPPLQKRLCLKSISTALDLCFQTLYLQNYYLESFAFLYIFTCNNNVFK